jgi:hypothetical protein
VFTDFVEVSLTLTIGADTIELPAGTLRSLEADVHPWGFRAKASFCVLSEGVEDAVFTPFQSLSVFKAKLSMKSSGPDAASPVPFELVGYVTQRRFRETIGDTLLGKPVVSRHYEIEYCDAAQAFWRQHFPVELLTDSSMKDALEQQKPEGVRLTYEHSRLDQKHPILCLGVRGDGPASFYDFVIWWIEQNRGVFELDAATGSYRIGDKKSKPTAVLVEYDRLAGIAVQVPDPLRWAGRVLNSFTEGVQKVSIDNENAATGVRRDVLQTSPIAADADRRARTETTRLAADKPCAELTFRLFPHDFVTTNQILRLGDGVSRALFVAGKSYRVVRVRLNASLANPDTEDQQAAAAPFQMELNLGLEAEGSPVLRLPHAVPPAYPVEFEGKIVSGSGGDNDRTWSAPVGSNSLATYRVQIPLWNKQVIAPFLPNQMPGHFFFPAYKQQRVAVAFGLHEAAIVRFLDWAENARLPSDTQGNQIAFGLSKINGTTLKHHYVDAKPVLRLERVLGGDLQTLELSDGTIRLETREDPSAQKVEPKFDVTVQVEAANERVSSDVGASVAGVTGKFEESIGGVDTKIGEATAEVESKVGEAEATVAATINKVQAQLEEVNLNVRGLVVEIVNAVSSAKAVLKRALED